jgi:hypothetical protein
VGVVGVGQEYIDLRGRLVMWQGNVSILLVWKRIGSKSSGRQAAEVVENLLVKTVLIVAQHLIIGQKIYLP